MPEARYTLVWGTKQSLSVSSAPLSLDVATEFEEAVAKVYPIAVKVETSKFDAAFATFIRSLES